MWEVSRNAAAWISLEPTYGMWLISFMLAMCLWIIYTRINYLSTEEMRLDC